MITENLTDDEIYGLGVELLSKRLGYEGMIRFLWLVEANEDDDRVYSDEEDEEFTSWDIDKLILEIDKDRKEIDKTSNPREQIAVSSNREVLTLTFDFLQTSAGESPINSLCAILKNLQDVMNKITMDLRKSDKLSEEVKQEASMSLLDIGIGSFEIMLGSTRNGNLYTNSASGNILGNTIDQFIELFQAGSSQETLKERLHSFTSKSIKSYINFLQSLKSNVATAKLKWASPNPDKGKIVSMSRREIERAVDVLDKIKERWSDELQITGTLTGFWPYSKNNKFQIKTEDADIVGMAPDQVLESIGKPKINETYTAKILRTVERNKTTNEPPSVEYELLTLEPVDTL